MIKLLEILKQLLFEEQLGLMKGKKYDYSVYKNPKSISLMESSLRAISDKDGNLYVLDHDGYEIIHSAFGSWLKNRGYPIPSKDAVWDNFTKCICWQRKRRTNEFYLSESYNYDQVEDIKTKLSM